MLVDHCNSFFQDVSLLHMVVIGYIVYDQRHPRDNINCTSSPVRGTITRREYVWLADASKYTSGSWEEMPVSCSENVCFLGLWCLMPLISNISVISWCSVLLMLETEVPGETTDMSQVTNKLDHIILYRVHLLLAGFELSTEVVIGTD